MRELEPKIAAWRAGMTALLPGQQETVTELEDHLRNHLAELLDAGVEAEEAFAQAAARLGEPRQIASELGKASRGKRPVSRALAAITFLVVVLQLILVLFVAFNHPPGGKPLVATLGVALAGAGYLAILGSGLTGGYVLATRSLAGREWERQAARRLLRRFAIAAAILVSTGVGPGLLWLSSSGIEAWLSPGVKDGAFAMEILVGLLLLAQSPIIASICAQALVAVIGMAASIWCLATSARTPVVPIGWLCLAFVASYLGTWSLRQQVKTAVITA